MNELLAVLIAASIVMASVSSDAQEWNIDPLAYARMSGRAVTSAMMCRDAGYRSVDPDELAKRLAKRKFEPSTATEDQCNVAYKDAAVRMRMILMAMSPAAFLAHCTEF
jgi:hypothetical protein